MKSRDSLVDVVFYVLIALAIVLVALVLVVNFL